MKNDQDVLLTNLKSLLQEKLWKLEKRLALERVSSPYKHLTEAESRVLATLRGENLSISEVGRRLGVSRQAVHKIVSQLVKEHILALVPAPENARDKLIVFTEKGMLLKATARKALKKIEDEVSGKLGEKEFILLKDLLSRDWW